jgi:hypothetical protein
MVSNLGRCTIASMRPNPGSVLRCLALPLLIALAACGANPPKPVPQAYLFEKREYQGVYGPDGRIMRLLYDQNGDRKADMVTLFYPGGGGPQQVEVDSDLDGVVDRWEYYAPDGHREREGWARKKPGRVDLWEYFDARGRLTRREYDDNGDGRIDRIEHYEAGELALVTVDSDHDGKMDRWQRWSNRRIVREELDIDGDGAPDRRLRYGPVGNVVAVEPIRPDW